MGLNNFVDPYKDPETGTLNNLVGARTKAALDQAEANLVPLRELELFSMDELSNDAGSEIQQIHRQLFQDIYDWAGKLRTVDIRKNIEGAEPFLAANQIPHALGYLESNLRDAQQLRDLNRRSFVEELAKFYDELNFIHPFREGNGRTQRVYWTRIALNAGWEINWLCITGSENDIACRVASEQKNLKPLQRIFDKSVREVGDTSEQMSTSGISLGGSAGYVSAETEAYEGSSG
ncbi:cell filamentation protein [Aurantimicrobium minutum]|uniref:Fic/DOC family protein n=1 Tax=Aurantimicrobium minutum TaxID=708131 RepID=UPI002474B745|nr:Fic family protein [Aurantimicrobium minutum]MDH6277647.1 cell filamentation protein [Aurantimicrobium minutum]